VVLFSAILSLRGVPVLASLGLRWHAPPSAMHSVLAGAGIGLLAGGLALGYLHLARMTDWIELPTPPTGERTALVLLAVLAAPLVEEVLFRGLLFQGLLRSVGLPFAVLWSAAVFAAVHPMPSWPPVFALGIATALVFHRSRFLPAAIAVHAAYNLVVVALQP
jgi:membrane protease YdiL (CAAX protease family)